MNIDKYRAFLDEIVHQKLYISSKLTEQSQIKLEEIVNFLKNSDNVLNNMRQIISLRNNDNSFVYDEYIEYFLTEMSLDIKLDILNNQDNYTDLIRNENIYLSIWNSLTTIEKIRYLEKKRKYTELDYVFINRSLNNNFEAFNEDGFFKKLLTNDIIENNLDYNSLIIECPNRLKNVLEVDDLNSWKYFTKDSYSLFILKSCKHFKDFLILYDNNPSLYNYLGANSLIFPSSDNEEIYSFLKKNQKFIGKFQNKYLDLFNFIEIKNIYNNSELDSESFSSIIQKMYCYDNENGNKYFCKDNLKRCLRHSISVFPFDNIDENLRNVIFNDYSLFNRFVDTIMIEAINSYFSEDDILSILRNSMFIKDASPYAIELLLNKLSFKATFNIIQKKEILDKITNLNVSIDEKDALFVKGFLDSPSLINKSGHNMIYEMLNLLDEKQFSYYIVLPYIINSLSNNDIVNLCLFKNFKIDSIFESEELISKLNTTDLITYINSSWSSNIDLSMFDNKEFCKIVFNLNDDQIKNINFNEVNYLFETIRMKGLLSKQNAKPTLLNYKSVLTSYLVLGLEESLNLVNRGNSGITLNDVLALKDKIIKEKILVFKEANCAIFQNIAKKVIDSINLLPRDTFEQFVNSLKDNTYLDNIIYLMLENDFDSYNKIINCFYNYATGNKEFYDKQIIYNYSNDFVDKFIENKAHDFSFNFDKIINKNFKLKEKIIYVRRKKAAKKGLENAKYRIFVKALTEKNNETYATYFKAGFDLKNIKNDYLKYLAKEEVEFDDLLNCVLIPLSIDSFDVIECLKSLGIKEPKDFKKYTTYINNRKNIAKINKFIKKYKYIYDSTMIINMLNYICFDECLNYNYKKTVINKLDNFVLLIKNILEQVYVDETKLCLVYRDNIDIYNLDEIKAYEKYIGLLNQIINKTKKYVSNCLDEDKIKNYYPKKYLRDNRYVEENIPFTAENYVLKKRVFSLDDIEKIFNGYDLSKYKEASKELLDCLFRSNVAVLVAEGYYDEIVDNLGIIIVNWDELYKLIDSEEFDLIQFNKLVNVINKDKSIIINESIIRQICKDDYYEVGDLNKRLNKLVKLYEDSFKQVSCAIPCVKYLEDNYKVCIIDKYNDDILKSYDNSLYKVGMIGNDFLDYSILNKNGFQIGIYKDNVMIAKALGVRNGNTLFINKLEGLEDDNYIHLLKAFANKLISVTKDDSEKIEFVTIVNNDLFNDVSGLKIDTTMCSIINYPINTSYLDYKYFEKNRNIINKIYTNYEDNISTLLASSNIVDKANFKYYDCEKLYLRNRKDVVKLSNNVSELYLNRINNIIYLYKLENKKATIEDIKLSIVDCIYLGDDFVIFVTKKNNIIKYILPYDKRAIKEVEYIINNL